MTLDRKQAQLIAERWLDEHVFQGGYVEDFVRQTAADLVSNIAMAVVPTGNSVASQIKPGVEWIAILTFNRAKSAQEFLARFKGQIDFGTTDKVIVFSNPDPDVITHVVTIGMVEHSLMTFTVNKIRVPGKGESND